MESTSPPNDVHEEKQAQNADRDVEHPPTTDTAESPSLENSKDLNRRRSFVDICTFGVIADPWRQKPWGARWRSSPTFLTSVVTIGIFTDLLTYTVVVPVLPYRLQALGYTNISSYTSILLICYSGGLAVATPPIAYYFFQHPYRRGPLLFGLVVLQLSLVLFMLATPFWAMCISRVLQGAASALVWNLGMVVICENTPHEHVGRNLGWALGGVSLGSTVGPLCGGLLYDHVGWHAPFIFCIVICAFDFVARLLLVERREVVRWGIGVGEDLRAVDEVAPPSPVVASSSENNAAKPLESREKAALETLAGRGAHPPPTLIPLEQADTSSTAVETSMHHSLQVSHTNRSSTIKKKPLTPIAVIVKMCSSPRAVTGFALCFIYGLILGSEDPTITLRVQSVWNRSSQFVGIMYLIVSVPTFCIGPIAGALADRYGAETLVPAALLLALPWQPLLSLKSSLPAFIAFFALSNALSSAFMTPVGRELAVASKDQEGIGEIHHFGAFNMAFAVSTCIGPIFGGQLYDRLSNGWTILCWIWFALLLVVIPLALWYTGERPLGKRLYYRMRKRGGIEAGHEMEEPRTGR